MIMLAQEIKNGLLKKCGNIEFDNIAGYKELESQIQAMQIKLQDRLQDYKDITIDILADKYSELIDLVANYFYIAGATEITDRVMKVLCHLPIQIKTSEIYNQMFSEKKEYLSRNTSQK